MSPKCSRRSVLKGAGISAALLGLPGGTAHLSAAATTSSPSHGTRRWARAVASIRGVLYGCTIRKLRDGADTWLKTAVIGGQTPARISNAWTRCSLGRYGA